MKLSNIREMTMRTGVNMDNMPFPDFNNQQLTFEGKMQHGYEVFSFKYKNTTIYGVKVGDEFASFVQLQIVTVPNYGNVAETLNSKTKQQYSKQLLSYKLRYFINKHLGISIMLGKVHSIATENVLNKISHLFDILMLNVKTGETLPYNVENYKNLTSISKVTQWQVLLVGNTEYPLSQQTESYVDWSDEKDRHMWTYGDFFKDIDVVDDLL